MKKIIVSIAICCLAAVLVFTGCSGNEAYFGKVSGAVTKDVPSEIYTEKDIKEAIKVAKKYFVKEFHGCELKEIYYAGDKVNQGWMNEKEYIKGKNADEIIVLLSSFYVRPNGGDGSLNQNDTYDGWNWLLVRSNGGKWRHVDHGY